MKTLPLFYYPSTWLWVDDDKILLSTMQQVFGKYNNIKEFSDPVDCINYLQQYHAPSSSHQFLQIKIHDEDYDLTRQTPMSFDISAIISLKNDNERHKEITAMVIDYTMPTLTGFDLAKKINHTEIPKILLTGNREEHRAIEGFNENLIDRFVQKAQENTTNKLKTYLQDLTYNYFQKLTAPLLSYLENDKKLPLSDPSFIDFFETYCKENDIREYYLVDKQGSFLCIDKNGKETCIVINTSNSIENWLKIYKNEKSLTPQNFEDIKSFKKIPFFGVNKEIWQFSEKNIDQYLHDSFRLEGREDYFYAIVEL